jgi:hypothetical protein
VVHFSEPELLDGCHFFLDELNYANGEGDTVTRPVSIDEGSPLSLPLSCHTWRTRVLQFLAGRSLVLSLLTISRICTDLPSTNREDRAPAGRESRDLIVATVPSSSAHVVCNGGPDVGSREERDRAKHARAKALNTKKRGEEISALVPRPADLMGL